MDVPGLIARYGVFALLLGAAAEGETMVVLGGVSVSHGLIPYIPAIAAAAAGSFLADQFFFALGRRARGGRLVERVRQRPVFMRVLRMLERRPVAFIFAFRFLWGLRTVSPIAIGTSDIPARLFVAVNAVAALCWATLFVTLGALFGEAIEAAVADFSLRAHSLEIGAALIVILSISYWLIRRRRLRSAIG